MSSLAVKEVWCFDENGTKYTVPSLAYVSQNVIDEVYHLTSTEGCSSQIFRNRWSNAKQKFLQGLKGTQISIDAFVTQLWTPVVTEFHADLQAISNGLQLPLHKVTELFEGLTDRKVLESEIEVWCTAFKVENRTWIRSAAQKIIDYQELTFYSKSAKTLMQLKSTLKLSGDFTILTKLLQEEEVIVHDIVQSNSYLIIII